MRVLKLPWLGHQAANKHIECFSVSINPEGTRLASGGLDGNVKIWDVNTILQFQNYKEDEDTQGKYPEQSLRRPLCSMSRHNGVVTSVKFSPDGKYLASGSDDKIVLIWEKDEEQTARPKQFGETEADLEHWTVRKRLVAHDNDVQDICWSPDGMLLVTVGLDRSIIIWNGVTLERIKRYDIHQSMVKGIVFDPANKFFATASDDRTVRIFRYYRKLSESSLTNYEFQMEHIVFEPFKKSPLTSYFRRMSWSPDGEHIAVPNATNGPVSSVAVINRGNWGTDISLIGHEAPCEVCSFSPRLFQSQNQLDVSKKAKDPSKNFSTILATAGQDRNLAIWSTSQSKPIVVAENIANNSVSDICWTPDGEKLFLSCQDGSITCVLFEPGELGQVVSTDIAEIQLHRYGADRESAVFPESIEQLQLESQATREEQVETKKAEPKVATPAPKVNELTPKINNLTPKQVNKLSQRVTMKNGKKRVAPLLISGQSSRPTETFAVKATASKKFKMNSKVSQPSYLLPRLGIQTSVHGIKLRAGLEVLNSDRGTLDDQDNDNDDMGIDVNHDSQSNLSGSTLRKKRNKRKRFLMESRYPSCFKLVSNLPETLFNNKAILNHEFNNALKIKDGNDTVYSSSLDAVDEDMLFQVIVRGIQHFPQKAPATNGHSEPTTSIIEVRNGPAWPQDDEELEVEMNDKVDFQDPTIVNVSNSEYSEYKKYTLYYQFRIQHVLPVVIDELLAYYVFVSFHGTVQIVFAESGNMVCPSLELGENVVMLKNRNGFVMCLTNTGLLFCWHLQGRGIKGILNGVSLAALVNSSNTIASAQTRRPTDIPTIITTNVRYIDIAENGSPYAVLEGDHSIYNYDLDLMAWTKVVDSWYFTAMNEDSFSALENDMKQLVTRNYSQYVQDVKRMRSIGYIFDSPNELQSCMVEKGQDMLSVYIR